MNDNVIDVAIIGGGSAGLGAARAVAETGRSVMLFEKEACGRSTSDNSLRIVHGGFRYLQTLHLSRVIESLRAQAGLVREFPDIVQPLPCLMPLARSGFKSRAPVMVAQALFRVLGASVVGETPPTRILDATTAEGEVDILKGRVPHGALLWTDALMLDQRALIDRWLGLCRDLGVVIHERTPVAAARERSDRVVLSTPAGEFEARIVVNAAGPEFPSVGFGDGGGWPTVGGFARAFNVVVRPKLTERYGVALEGEGRHLFAVPRGEYTAIGTGYLLPLRDGGARVTESEVAAFLIEASRSLPEPLTLSDIVHLDVGLLPMTGETNGAPVLQGAERLERKRRIITVISTKYTTFYEQGKRVAQMIAQARL